MAKTSDASHVRADKRLKKRMSDHIAMALVAYTLLLIFMVTPKLASGSSVWPYFLLIVFVGIVIPFFRSIDRRWDVLDNSELSGSGLKTRYAIDRIKLWAVALGLPMLLSILCKILSTSS
jgi:hypothetical protein